MSFTPLQKDLKSPEMRQFNVNTSHVRVSIRTVLQYMTTVYDDFVFQYIL